MSFGRTSLLLILAFFGFAVGAAIYTAFDLLIAPHVSLTVPTIIGVVNAPWFLFGMLGLAVILTGVLIFARTAKK